MLISFKIFLLEGKEYYSPPDIKQSFSKSSLYQLKSGIVAEEEDSVFLFMNLFVTAFAKICALAIKTLKHSL